MMQPWLAWLGQLALSIVGSAVLIVGALRYLPDVLTGVILKKIDHRNQVALEKLKAELSRESSLEIERLKAEVGATFSTIKTGVDFIASAQSELRTKIIAATEKLWSVERELRKAFSHVVFLENVLLPNEINEMFRNDIWPPYFEHIKNYASDDYVHKRWTEGGAEEADMHRLFVSEQLWLLFFVFRAFNARLAYLYTASFKKKQYIDWRTDGTTVSLLRGVVDGRIVEQAVSGNLGSAGMINDWLEAAFLKEALRVMSGMRTLSDTIAEIGSTLLAEKEKLSQTLNEKAPLGGAEFRA